MSEVNFDIGPLGVSLSPGGVGLNIGGLSLEQRTNLMYARAIAAREGIPESVLLGVLWQEGKFANDPGGNGGGMAQALGSTAADFGYTQEELRNNPRSAIEFAAKYLKNNYNYLGKDWEKAAAGYFMGPGNIELAASKPGNWIDNADIIARNQKLEATASDYLHLTGIKAKGVGSRPKTKEEAEKLLGLKPSTTTTATAPRGDRMPDPEDYKITNPDGSVEYDQVAYAEAVDTYVKRLSAKKMEKDLLGDSMQSYINDIIAQTASEISAGKLDLDKANALVSNRVNSYKSMLEAYSDDAFKYAAPATGDYLPGAEPGGFWEQRGVKPVRADRSTTLSPLDIAMKSINQSDSLIGAINTPRLPDISSIRRSGTVPGSSPPMPSAVSAPGFLANSQLNPSRPNNAAVDYQSLAEQLLRDTLGEGYALPNRVSPAASGRSW